jgi:type IV pilus assembly protein PilC
VTTKDLVVFTRQLATMIDAGLPIVQCLEILAQQTPNKAFAKCLHDIKAQVESGGTFADSLRKHPKIFDQLYISMVSAGEAGGILDTILGRLAIYKEKAARLKAKIKGAMIYPASIVTVAVIVTAILLVFVIPVFAEMFAGVGRALPAPTRLCIALSDFTIAYAKHIVLALIALGVGLRFAYRTQRGRMLIDSLVLRLPVFGPLVRKAAVARFTRTLSTLISSGVPILDALSITATTSGNRVVEKAVLKARQSISEGKPLTAPLAESPTFPPMVCQMIHVGETTGALDSMLQKIADFYEDEVDNAVANLTALMEPLVIVFLGVVIGGIVVSMYLPIFQLGALFTS